jgi:holo-ACP synthase citX
MFKNPSPPVTLSMMLEHREHRVFEQDKLRNTYHTPLISFTMNIPGPIKSAPIIRRAFDEGKRILLQYLEDNNLRIIESNETHECTGDELLIAIDADPEYVKDITSSIEEYHPYGRIFDIDVLDKNGNKLSRKQYRTCLLCNKQAQDCARNRTHTVDELTRAINNLLSTEI